MSQEVKRKFNFSITNQDLSIIEIDCQDNQQTYAFIFGTPLEKQQVLNYQSWSDLIPNENDNRFVFFNNHEEWVNNILKNDTEGKLMFKPTVVMNNKYIFVINKFKYYKEKNQMVWIVTNEPINILNDYGESDINKEIPEGEYKNAFFDIDSYFACPKYA